MTNRPGEPRDLAALSELAPELAATFASVASDIALIVDADGVIRNVAQGGAEPLAPEAGGWVGRPWVDTVTGETRRKVEQLLAEALAGRVSRRREINHASPSGVDIPVAYAAVRLGAGGPVLAAGRDLRAVAAIQQRLVDTQQELERDYWKLRQTESHYRVLFQVATDAVCVLDADSLCLLDANQAAIRMFDAPIEQLIGKEVTLAIDAASKPAVEELLTSARASGRAGEIRARLTGRRGVIALSATPFRAGGSMRLLLRARSVERREDDEQTAATISALVERMLDAVVVTDSNGRILMANPAFVELTRRGSEAQVKGRPLSDWVGMTPGEVTTMVARARRVGIVPFVATSLRGPGARPLDVQASAALLPEGDQECVGFTLRLAAGPGAQADHADLLTALDRLAVQIGKPSLPELMQRVTELAERHIVVGALDRAGGDRRAAADALGISAHDLEQRLRRLQHPLSAGNGESRPAGRAAAGDGPSTPAS